MMKLALLDEHGTVLESWQIGGDVPLEDQEPDVFEAILNEIPGRAYREQVQAELDRFALRADAERG